MLDFQKLMPQIAALAEETQENNDVETAILGKAQNSFEEAARDQTRFENKLRESGGTTFWPCALPLEDMQPFIKLSTPPQDHAVVACDGSQIMPTQHEVASCFLLNIGAVVLNYGEKSKASLTSFPFLYHSHDEIYPLINKRRIHIDEATVSFERALKELEQARLLAEKERNEKQQVLTMIDGSLIPFNIDRNQDRLQEELLERFAIELDAFNAAELPLVGYISHSRSSDIVNILRVWRCPYRLSRCQLHCSNIDEPEFPCSEIWPLSDRYLMHSLLPEAHRSAFFLSGARASQSLALRNRICFSYLNTGYEAARIEIPSWLFEDKKLLEFSLNAVLMQAQKGNGYPISLSEAHNQAVVRQQDRKQFFQLVAQKLMKTRQPKVTVSPKESKKRSGIV